MTEYRRQPLTQKTEQYLGANGKSVRSKQDAIFVSVKNESDDQTFYEHFARVSKNSIYERSGISAIDSAVINPSFVKLTEKEANDYKSYLYNGKHGLYNLTMKSLKARGVLWEKKQIKLI